MANRHHGAYKLILDAVLLLFLALMYQKQALGMRFHELGGLALCVLFIVHKLLNRKWIAQVTAGIFRGRVRLNSLWVTDLLLLLAVTGVLVTGLCISRTLPTALRNGFRLQTWHYFAAAVSLVLTGVHLGLHWPLIRNAVWNKLPLRGRVRQVTGIVLLCALLGGGGYSLASSSVLSWLSRPFSSGLSARAVPESGSAGRNAAFRGNISPADSAEAASGDAAPESAGTRPGRNADAPARREMPNGGKGRNQAPGGSFSSVLRVIRTYLPTVCFFAALTACIRALFRRRKRNTPQGSAARS